MIIGSINDIQNLNDLYYKYGIPQTLIQCMIDLINLKNSTSNNQIRINSKVFANIEDTKTFPPEERKPEYHKDFIDIHLVIKGSEKIGFKPCSHQEITKQAITEFDSEKDLGFTKDSCLDYVDLNVGDFAIFFPEELHKPLCHTKNHNSVTKIIMKIHKSVLIN
jgi:biofilm protein TabA